MSKILVDKQWNAERGEYEPINWRIEGDGPCWISFDLAEDCGLTQESSGFYFGPFRLQIIDFDHDRDAYECEIVNG